MNNMQYSFVFTITTFFIVISSSVFTIHAIPDNPFPYIFPNITSIPPINITATWDSFRNLSGCRSGDEKPGLAKLKQYFQQFGYLNNYSNFSNDFDDSFKTALETYQRNFNLNCTGELDETTIQQILRPRCGVADIVNGTSSMNSGKPPASPNKLGIVAHYSYFPGSPRWPEGQTELSYAFSPGNQLDDSVKAVFRTAFDRWSEVTPLTFTVTESFRKADIKIGFFTGDHGDGEPFDGVLGTLAHAFSPPDGRFHLDGAENWVIDAKDLKSTSAVDLESVVVHEIGHLLGLGHSSVEDSIMWPSIPSGTRRVQLAGDDIDGIQSLYGTNPNYNGSSNPGLQERETNGASLVGPTFGWILLVAVGLVSFIL